MSKLSKIPQFKEDISIKAILDCLIEYWKLIFSMGATGLLFAFGLIFLGQNSYEARALIKVAQIHISQFEAKNVESNNNLISRMNFPKSFTSKNITDCGLQGKKKSDVEILELFKIIQIKGVQDVIELKVTLDTKEKSISCAQSLYENIRESQQKIIKNNINIIKSNYKEISNTIETLEKKSIELSKSVKIDRDYYHTLNNEKIINLLIERERLNGLLNSDNWISTELLLPIYVSDTPVSPNIKLILIAGTLIGLFSGIFVVLIRNARNIFL